MDDTIEKRMPDSHMRAARWLILAIVGAVNGRTLAVWACNRAR